MTGKTFGQNDEFLGYWISLLFYLFSFRIAAEDVASFRVMDIISRSHKGSRSQRAERAS